MLVGRDDPRMKHVFVFGTLNDADYFMTFFQPNYFPYTYNVHVSQRNTLN